jgi:hypothetical protein
MEYGCTVLLNLLVDLCNSDWRVKERLKINTKRAMFMRAVYMFVLETYLLAMVKTISARAFPLACIF